MKRSSQSHSCTATPRSRPSPQCLVSFASAHSGAFNDTHSRHHENASSSSCGHTHAESCVGRGNIGSCAGRFDFLHLPDLQPMLLACAHSPSSIQLYKLLLLSANGDHVRVSDALVPCLEHRIPFKIPPSFDSAAAVAPSHFPSREHPHFQWSSSS